jgi:hypothetical protein
VAGAAVRVNQLGPDNSAATSKPDGTFRIELPKPFVAETTLTASNADGTKQGILSLHKSRQSLVMPFRIVLKPSHAVNATVIDAVGQPVANAMIEIAFWGGQIGTALTDAQGKAKLLIPAEVQAAYVIAYKSGVGADYFEEVRSIEVPLGAGRPFPDAVQLVLNGAAPVEVRTLDTTGKPVAGVNVTLCTLQKKDKASLRSWTNRFTATSNAQGHAIFDWIPTDLDRIEFSIQSDDYEAPKNPQFRIENGGDPRHLTVRLLRKSLLSGRVTFPDGKPALGILVQAEGMGNPSSFRDWTRTSNDGTYRHHREGRGPA